MSFMTISDITFSAILLQIGKFEIGLRFSIFSGGQTFGIGVISSTLYLAGQVPVLRLVLIITVNGVLKKTENLFITLAGMSPGSVACRLRLMGSGGVVVFGPDIAIMDMTVSLKQCNWHLVSE